MTYTKSVHVYLNPIIYKALKCSFQDKLYAASDKSFCEIGRFVIITHEHYVGNLAIILSSNVKKVPKEFR